MATSVSLMKKWYSSYERFILFPKTEIWSQHRITCKIPLNQFLCFVQHSMWHSISTVASVGAWYSRKLPDQVKCTHFPWANSNTFQCLVWYRHADNPLWSTEVSLVFGTADFRTWQTGFGSVFTEWDSFLTDPDTSTKWLTWLIGVRTVFG